MMQGCWPVFRQAEAQGSNLPERALHQSLFPISHSRVSAIHFPPEAVQDLAIVWSASDAQAAMTITQVAASSRANIVKWLSLWWTAPR